MVKKNCTADGGFLMLVILTVKVFDDGITLFIVILLFVMSTEYAGPAAKGEGLLFIKTPKEDEETSDV